MAVTTGLFEALAESQEQQLDAQDVEALIDRLQPMLKEGPYADSIDQRRYERVRYITRPDGSRPLTIVDSPEESPHRNSTLFTTSRFLVRDITVEQTEYEGRPATKTESLVVSRSGKPWMQRRVMLDFPPNEDFHPDPLNSRGEVDELLLSGSMTSRVPATMPFVNRMLDTIEEMDRAERARAAENPGGFRSAA